MKEKEYLKYDYITEEMLPDKDSKEYEDFKKRAETEGTIWLTPVEYLRFKKFQKDHLECVRDSNTGFSKFGTIGGGMTCSFLFTDSGRKVFAGCSGCKTESEITEGSNGNVYDEVSSDELPKTEEEMIVFMKKTYWGRKFALNDVEFMRFCKFKEDFLSDEKKGDLKVSFCPTGLGDMVAVKYMGLKDTFSITDSTHW